MADSVGDGWDTWVTWGALQGSDTAWTAACLEEAWVIITQEDADAASLDIDALRADIDALHGTGRQRDSTRASVPVPASDHAAFLAELAYDIRKAVFAKARTWLTVHGTLL